MSSLQEIEEESKEFAKQWRAQLVRGMVAILLGALLYLIFSPTNLIEYIATSVFMTPLFVWAYKKPISKKERVITSILCYLLAVVIYMVWV